MFVCYFSLFYCYSCSAVALASHYKFINSDSHCGPIFDVSKVLNGQHKFQCLYHGIELSSFPLVLLSILLLFIFLTVIADTLSRRIVLREIAKQRTPPELLPKDTIPFRMVPASGTSLPLFLHFTSLLASLSSSIIRIPFIYYSPGVDSSPPYRFHSTMPTLSKLLRMACSVHSSPLVRRLLHFYLLLFLFSSKFYSLLFISLCSCRCSFC